MERGKMTIQYRPHSNDVVIDLQLVNDTVWLAKSEIAEQFNLFLPAVTTNLKQLEKQDKAFYDAGTMEIHIPNSECVQILYNLDIIIELSYRMKGGYCRHVRNWFSRQLKRSISQRQRYVTVLPMNANDQILN